MVVLAFIPNGFVGPPLGLCLIAAFCLALALAARGFPTQDEDLLPLRDLPEQPNTYLVNLRVEREGVSIGEDNGTLAFVDGWLVYSGLRTEFNFSARDCRYVESGNGKECLFGCLVGGVAILFSLRCQAENWRLENVITEFLKGPKPDGEGVLPPCRPQPGSIRLVHVTYAVMLVLLVATFALLAMHIDSLWNGREKGGLGILSPILWFPYSMLALRFMRRRLRALRRFQAGDVDSLAAGQRESKLSSLQNQANSESSESSIVARR